MRFKGLLILIGVLCLSQAKSQMVRFGGNITGISYTQVSGDTFQIRGTFNDLTGVSVGTDLDSNDVYWTPPLNAGDTCRRARVISADTLFVGFVVFTVDMNGQGNPSTQNSKVMRETPNQNLDYIPQGGDEALRECISQYYSNILDDKLGQGGGLASVLVDSVTIFGDGLNSSLYVDSSLFVTQTAFQDSLGDGQFQQDFVADGINAVYQVDSILPNEKRNVFVYWNGQGIDDEYITNYQPSLGSLELSFIPDAGDRIVVKWFDGNAFAQTFGGGGVDSVFTDGITALGTGLLTDKIRVDTTVIATQSDISTKLDSVFTSMRLIGNGTAPSPLDIDTMYVASKEYVDNSIAAAGGGDITGVNESPQYGISGGGASGAVNLSVDTSVIASKDWVNNSITLGDITAVTAGYGITGGATSGNATVNTDTTVIASKDWVSSNTLTGTITLGTQTDGNYIATAGVSGNGLSGSATGEGSTFTVNSNATNTNTPSTIVYRDASGNFSAGTITANLSGNASTASALQTGRTIALGSDLSGSQTFDGSGNITISAQVADDSHNHIISNIDNLQTSLNNKVDDFTGTGLVKSTAGTVSYVTDNSSSWNLAYNDKVNNIGVSGTTTKTITLTQQDGGTLTGSFTDLQGAGVTISNSGNRRVPVITTSTNIDGNTGWWINTSGELVDNQSEGLSGASTGYDFKMSGSASIGTLDVQDLNPNGAVDFGSNIAVNGTSLFSGSTGNSVFNAQGGLGIQTTPSTTISLVARRGAIFNNENSSAYGDVRMKGATENYMFFLNASEDKIGIAKSNPVYTFDVTGDINFTGDLYKNGSLFTSGVSISNNADNRLVTGSATANTIEAEQNLTYDNTNLRLVTGDLRLDYTGSNGGGVYMRNSTTGSTASDGGYMYMNGEDIYIDNKESNGNIQIRASATTNYLQLTASGFAILSSLSGTGTTGVDVDGSGVLIRTGSDGRYKTVISDEIEGIDAVMKLKPVVYKWHDNVPNYDGYNEIGFIAQDVKQAIPLAVPYEQEENSMLNYKDRAVIATLTKATQEQQAEIESLKAQIKELQNLVLELIKE